MIIKATSEEAGRIKLYLESNYSDEFLSQFVIFNAIKGKNGYYIIIYGVNKSGEKYKLL